LQCQKWIKTKIRDQCSFVWQARWNRKLVLAWINLAFWLMQSHNTATSHLQRSVSGR
jgi:hypothetical protein